MRLAQTTGEDARADLLDAAGASRCLRAESVGEERAPKSPFQGHTRCLEFQIGTRATYASRNRAAVFLHNPLD